MSKSIVLRSKKTIKASFLHVVVNEAERDKEQHDPWDGVDADDEDAEDGEEAREEYVEYEGEAVVDGVEVRRESVEDPPDWRGVEERRPGLHDDADQLLVDVAGGTDPAVSEEEGARQTKEGVGAGDAAVDGQVEIDDLAVRLEGHSVVS